MKANIPLIGEVRTGKDVDTKVVEKVVEKLVTGQLGAGFIDLSNNSLTNYKTVSSRLLEAFRGWVFANVSVLSEEVSKMEFELYKTVYKGGELELVKVDQHPLLDLLDKFNSFTTTSDAMYTVQADIELAGDVFLQLEGGNVKNGESIENIYILEPDKVEVVPGNNGNGQEVVKYIYKSTIDGKVVEKHYKPEEVIQIKTPNPSNPLRGKSVVEAAAVDIDTDNLSREMLMMFFKNGAVPNVVFSTEQKVTANEVKRLTTDIRRTYTGVKNAFKTLVLGNGLKPEVLQQSNKEVQLLEIKNQMRDDIMAMFKNTKASLGIVEDVNRANAEATLLSWKQSVIKPKMMRIVDTLNEFLVPRFGDNLILTFVDPVPENLEDDIDQSTKMYEAGIMTLNEARERVNLDAVPEGDDFKNGQVVSTEPIPDKSLPKNLRNVSYKKHFRKMNVYVKLERYKTLYATAIEIAKKQHSKSKVKKATKAVDREHPVYTNEQVWDYHEKKMHIVDNTFDMFYTEVERFITRLEDKSIASLHTIADKRAKVAKPRVRKTYNLWDNDAEVAAGVDLFTPLVENVAKLSGDEAYQLMSMASVYQMSTNMQKRIQQNVELFVASVVGTDKEKLSSILAQGFQEGQSIPQIEQAIRNTFSQYKKNQAEKVARTEMLRASNDGTLDAFKQSDVVTAKQWLTAMDDRVDPECERMNKKIVGLESAFFKTDFGSGMVPPLHPNCRCDILPVLIDTDTELRKYVKQLEEMIGIQDELPR